MTVEGKIRGGENDAAVENGQKLLNAFRHALVPELEMAAVFFPPVFIEIKEEVQAAVELELGMFVEIGVDP